MTPLAVGLIEAAAMLGIAARTLRKFASERRLPSVKLGGRLLFRLSDLEAFLAANTRPVPKRSNGAGIRSALLEINAARRRPLN